MNMCQNKNSINQRLDNKTKQKQNINKINCKQNILNIF